MKQEREMAVAAMKKLGWTAERTKRGKTPSWDFKRPDTGGLWDVVFCRQDQLSMRLVAETAMRYGDAPDLVGTIHAAEDAWLRARFPSIFSAVEPTP